MEVQPSKCIKVGSFNCKGHGIDRLDYIAKLMTTIDVLFVQEHWYFDDNIVSLANNMNNVHVHGVSGMDSNVLLHGRPYGGCAFLYKKDMNCIVKPVDVFSNRCCAIILDLQNGVRMLLFNVYMPCDTVHDLSNLDTYMDVLNKIDIVCTDYPDINRIVIGGDFNTDISRLNSLHTDALLGFIRSNGFKLCLNDTTSNVSYTYENVVTGSQSIIDHFLISDQLSQCVLKYESIHEGDNLSDHCPLVLELNVLVDYDVPRPRCYVRKPNWKTATDVDILAYKGRLHSLLENINIPRSILYCTDLLCKTHGHDIDSYYNDIISACDTAASRCIPASGKFRLAGWNDHVKPYRDQSIFWHRLWVDNDRPRHGIIADIRRRTRTSYHHAVKKLKSDQAKLKANKMATALQSQNGRDLWSEVKRINSKKMNVPNTVDNAQGDVEIGRLFSDKYKDLYNSVPYDVNAMNNVCRDLEHNIINVCNMGNYGSVLLPVYK